MSKTIEMPNPTEADLNSPEFEAIWQLIKSWDVNVPSHYAGYCGANGSHVKMILDVLRAAPVVERKPVAYLDIGAGGYMDLGSDLSDEELSRLPYGRHVLAIAGTYGIDGYTSPPAPVMLTMPETKDEGGGQSDSEYYKAVGWNACLDKVKELNQ